MLDWLERLPLDPSRWGGNRAPANLVWAAGPGLAFSLEATGGDEALRTWAASPPAVDDGGAAERALAEALAPCGERLCAQGISVSHTGELHAQFGLANGGTVSVRVDDLRLALALVGRWDAALGGPSLGCVTLLAGGRPVALVTLVTRTLPPPEAVVTAGSLDLHGASAWAEVAQRASAGEAMCARGDFGIAWVRPGAEPVLAFPGGECHPLGAWLAWWEAAAGEPPQLDDAWPAPAPLGRLRPTALRPHEELVRARERASSRLLLRREWPLPPRPSPLLGGRAPWPPGTLLRLEGAPPGELVEVLSGGSLGRHVGLRLPSGALPAPFELATPPRPWSPPGAWLPPASAVGRVAPSPYPPHAIALLSPPSSHRQEPVPPRAAPSVDRPPVVRPNPAPKPRTKARKAVAQERYQAKRTPDGWRIFDTQEKTFTRGAWPTPERPRELAARLNASDAMRASLRGR